MDIRPGSNVRQPTLYKEEYCWLLEEDMAKGYTLGAFAGSIGVSRATITNWMREHPEFFAAASRGKAKRQRQWETMALGAASGQLEKANAGMIRLGPTNAGAEDWVERSETRHYGAVGQYDLTSIPDGKLNTILEILSLAAPVADSGGGDSGASTVPLRRRR